MGRGAAALTWSAQATSLQRRTSGQKGMDAMMGLRSLLLQIKSRWVANTRSQVVMALGLSLLIIGFSAATPSTAPQMVPITARVLSSEEIAMVEGALKGKYPYQVQKGQVLVPAQQAYAIRGELASESKMPPPTGSMTPNLWFPDSTAPSSREYVVGLQRELTQWLRNFPYVDDAAVVISMGQPATTNGAALPPRASVCVKTPNAVDLTAYQARAVVEFIRGAVPGMKVQDVVLVCNGARVFSAAEEDARSSGRRIGRIWWW
jgi:flagellar biosynthesis/type III secretory pathway M-ring protein FliF/YscJ